MTTPSILAPITERVELLLAKHEALEHANRLLTEEIQALQRARLAEVTPEGRACTCG